MDDKYWIGKNVLITGVNGFIGGSLAKSLVSRGCNVIGLMRNQKKGTLLHVDSIIDHVTIINGDVTDKELLFSIISEEQIEYIYHLAAQVEVGVGVLNPYITFESNIKGVYSLLEAVRLSGDLVKSVVVASTDKAYGSYDSDMMPYKEDYALKPMYPYDVSKACGDMIARSYASDVYNLPIIVTRFCNIYGPGQLNFSALFPDGIRSALGYSTFIPRGNGEQVRDFIYIDDVIDLYIKIGKKLADDPDSCSGEVFNAGTNSPITVKQVLQEIFTAVDNYNDFEIIENSMLSQKTIGEIDYQYMDYDKAFKYFSWKPEHSLKYGTEKTIDWFKQYLREKYK
jgi:CDP-glucose 4,6-dehydratase